MATEVESAWSPAKRFKLINPNFTGNEMAVLQPANSSEQYFGREVKITDDGNTAYVGTGQAIDGRGHITSYVRLSDGTWSYQERFPLGDEFSFGQGAPSRRGYGSGFSISGDGNTLVVCDSEYDDEGNISNPHYWGIVYIYSKSSGSWVTIAAIKGTYVNQQFGSDTAINQNGTKLVVYAKGDRSGETNRAFIYNRSGNNWNPAGFLSSYRGLNVPVVGQVAMSDDGSVILSGDNVLRNGSLTELPITPIIHRLYPYSGHAVSGDGNYIAIGSPATATQEPQGGKVLLYKWNGTAWILEKTIRPNSPIVGEFFGASVTFGRNSKRLIVGAPFYRDYAAPNGATIYNETGGVYTFELSSNWGQSRRLTPSNGASRLFGSSVASTRDGSIVACGAENTPLSNYRYGTTVIFG